MANLRAPIQTIRRRQRSQFNLLVPVAVPLVLMHLGLLLERALRQEMMDGVVATRWILSIGLLLLLRRFDTRNLAFKAPAFAVAAILIFVLIHAPVAALEPSLPIAATGLGLALTLVAVDRHGGNRTLAVPVVRLSRNAPPKLGPGLSQESVKDRAPPAFA